MGQKEKETHVVSVANQKGGIGKSTITISTATTLALEFGKKVLVIDCDRQQSVKRFGELKDPQEFPPYAIDVVSNPLDEARSNESVINWVRSLEGIIREALGKYDYIFIDVPGYIDKNLITVFAYTDFVLIPVVMSEMDILSTQDFIQQTIKKVQVLKEKAGDKFQVRFVLNKADNRKNIKLIKDFSEMTGISALSNGLRMRTKHYDQDLSLKTGITKGDKEHEIYEISKEMVRILEGEN